MQIRFASTFIQAESQIVKFIGRTWCPPGSCRSQVGPMLAPWTLLSGMNCIMVLNFAVVYKIQTKWNSENKTDSIVWLFSIEINFNYHSLFPYWIYIHIRVRMAYKQFTKQDKYLQLLTQDNWYILVRHDDESNHVWLTGAQTGKTIFAPHIYNLNTFWRLYVYGQLILS